METGGDGEVCSEQQRVARRSEALRAAAQTWRAATSAMVRAGWAATGNGGVVGAGVGETPLGVAGKLLDAAAAVESG